MSGTNRSTKSKDELLSRSLTWVLRHQAKALGLSISMDGYVSVSEILKCHKRFRGYQVEDVKRVVENCAKQRFKLTTMSDDDGTGKIDNQALYIRANQGHTIQSVEDKMLLETLSASELAQESCIVHGTTREAWESIQQDGALSRMKRKHIHFAVGLPDDKGVVSGMRKSSQIYIYIDSQKCANDGIIFYRSENNVLLTAGVDNGKLPFKYFSDVIDARTRSSCLSYNLMQR